MNGPRVVCFLSDYGYEDDFAGTCRGVIASLAPDIRVIDITHGLARHDVLGAAFVLRNSMRYMPDGAVHLAVVDPGVGGPRRAVALRSGGDRLFVGPDNGLLSFAVAAAGGATRAVSLTNRALWRDDMPATFHGRDLFMPVAGHLVAGTPLDEAGEVVAVSSLVTLPVPQWRLAGTGLAGTGWPSRCPAATPPGNSVCTPASR